MRLMGRAIADYQMIREGDRILLGLSGGKDSISLLMALRHLQTYAPITFELAAATVDPQIHGFDPSPLKDFLQTLNIPYFYQRQDIQGQAHKSMQGDSFCAFCSRLKRGILYSTARKQGYNCLALAQHLDDLAESFLLSAFFNGKLNTMKAHYTVRQRDIRVIRPLVYIREQHCRQYANSACLPIIRDNCPACFSKPTQREAMKQLLQTQEAQHPKLFQSLRQTLRPLMAIDSAVK